MPQDAPRRPAAPPLTVGRLCLLLQAVHSDASSLEGGLLTLLDELEADERARFETHLDGLRSLLQRLREHPLGAVTPGEARLGSPSALAAFAALVRLRREAAGLSRAKLARRTGLSEATLKLLESGRHCPSRFTLLRLLQARELGLRWEDIIQVRPELKGPEPAELPVRDPGGGAGI